MLGWLVELERDKGGCVWVIWAVCSSKVNVNVERPPGASLCEDDQKGWMRWDKSYGEDKNNAYVHCIALQLAFIEQC